VSTDGDDRAPRDNRGAVAFRVAGSLCVAAAVAGFLAGLLVYRTGFEPALLLMMLAFAGFVFGIGLLAAARRSLR
jgi:hypothetical protein